MSDVQTICVAVVASIAILGFFAAYIAAVRAPGAKPPRAAQQPLWKSKTTTTSTPTRTADALAKTAKANEEPPLRIVNNPQAPGYIQVWRGDRTVIGAPWAEPAESWRQKASWPGERGEAYKLIADMREGK